MNAPLRLLALFGLTAAGSPRPNAGPPGRPLRRHDRSRADARRLCRPPRRQSSGHDLDPRRRLGLRGQGRSNRHARAEGGDVPGEGLSARLGQLPPADVEEHSPVLAHPAAISARSSPTWPSRSRWVHAHAAEFGGDPDFLFVMGHSAGARPAALLCTDERYLQAEGSAPPGQGLHPGRWRHLPSSLQIDMSTPRWAAGYRLNSPTGGPSATLLRPAG